MADRPTTEV